MKCSFKDDDEANVVRAALDQAVSNMREDYHALAGIRKVDRGSFVRDYRKLRQAQEVVWKAPVNQPEVPS